MESARKCYLVSNAFKAVRLDDGKKCKDLDVDEPAEIPVTSGSFLWAYDEEDGWVRFTLSQTTLCVGASVFSNCTERYVSK
jgi:hypothetical protein